MSVKMTVLQDRDRWFSKRSNYIGGSDAASIIGMNPYRNNVDLWEIKTGRVAQEDISDKPYVRYGTLAEEHLRALYALDYPQYKVLYVENNMFLNDKYPFAHASLDGWLLDPNGRKGILEIKTTNILNSAMKDKWKDRIPDNYYVQVLHYLMVTEFDFVELKAQLKYDIDGEIFEMTKHYHIERSDVEEDIKYLAEQEEKFWKYVRDEIRPPAILPI